MESKPSRAFLDIEKGRLKMKLREIDRTEERSILTAYIVSTDFIQQVEQWMQDSFIDGHGARTIRRWCVEYYKRYSKAPFKYIENIFLTARAENELDDDEADYIERFLTSLSGE